MAHTVELTSAAQRELAKLTKRDPKLLTSLVAAIYALEADPRPPGSKKLSGNEDFYRIRVGEHRVVYEMKAERVVVLVIRIGHRRDIYKRR